MLFFSLVALEILTGALGRDEKVCQLRIQEACHQVHSIFPREFPGTIEDLRNDCSNLYRSKQCIADSSRNCSSQNADDNGNEISGEDRQRMNFVQGFINVMTQICDENSELHRNFVPYLSCLKSVMEGENEQVECADYINNAIDFLRSRIESKARMAGRNENDIRKIRDEIMICLRSLMSMNCLIMQSQKMCDSGVKGPILEIIKKLGTLGDYCPASSRIDVIQLLDVLTMVSKEEIHIKELIRVDLFS